MVHTDGGDLESEKSCKQRCHQKSFMELILAQPLQSQVWLCWVLGLRVCQSTGPGYKVACSFINSYTNKVVRAKGSWRERSYTSLTPWENSMELSFVSGVIIAAGLAS